MALELLGHYRKDVSELKLVPSGGGRFEILVNGKQVFSKLKEKRYPDPVELKKLIG